MRVVSRLFAAAALLRHFAGAQSSCDAPSPSGNIRPSVASGYSLQVVATGLSKPRGLKVDNEGNLLVVEAGSGVVSAHVLNDDNGCVTVTSSTNVTDAIGLNHGIELSSDGLTLYASNPSSVYSWAYDSSARTASSQATVVSNMTTDDHTTRTLLLSQKVPGMLLVTRGSTSNIDLEAASLDSGHSQIKAFQLSNRSSTVYDFNSDGLVLGWGLRNDVGVAEHPQTGGIYSVENSADQITRMGVDVHQNNPAEELNYFGSLDNGSSTPSYAEQGAFFGYPWCFAAWDVGALPNTGNLTVGAQFAVDASNDTDGQNQTDAWCAAQAAAPRLVFQAHMAPLDIKFNASGSEAWVSFHGSWDRTDPVGYKVSVVQFGGGDDVGQPTEPSTSTTAAADVVANRDNSVCPDDCFRPVGLAVDKSGRIFMSSDASGEVYLITKTSGGATTTSSGSAPSSSTSSPAALRYSSIQGSGVAALFASLLVWLW
ncbi:L-sorbosone dehydrogenase [Xylariaceae sp. FL0804]|nr:L-sorbosone dehydrogenase [Xylariaceae sp. FL0804]